MAQSKSGMGTCQTCGGRGIIATPNGKQWQACPNCGGEGLKQNVIRVPWTLQFAATLTANQQNVPVVTQQDTDADFEWIYSTASSSGLFSAAPQDMATGRNLSQTNVNGELLFGTAQLPFVHPEPYIISRGSAFKYTLNDRSGANNTIAITLHGYKLFPAGAPMQGSAGSIVRANQ